MLYIVSLYKGFYKRDNKNCRKVISVSLGIYASAYDLKFHSDDPREIYVFNHKAGLVFDCY